ncbi:unnamed protein product [Adineta steineri]|uniref:Uncharacterized protein n=1 Tax=Adineta steineri TaxID=433720 RepID=A0A819X1D9_9BILA|nr:unnamed protein product [Adineta steineri]
MQLIIIIIMVFVSELISISSISVGSVSQARLLPGLKNESIWLINQTNASICLCNALKLYSLNAIAGLNSFLLNSTCQLILSPPVLSPTIVYDTQSTLILLHPFTDAPCCSDFSWLLARVQGSQRRSSDTVSLPADITINSANTLVSTITANGPLVRFNRNNLSLAVTYSLPSGYLCSTAYYRSGRFFVGCTTPTALVVFNEINMTSPVTIINTGLKSRSAAFVRNDTIMFVAVQYGSTPVMVYNANLTTNTYISLNTTFPSTFSFPWALNTVNDSFVLLSNWGASVPVYALKSSSNISNTWSMVALNVTKVSSSEELADAIIDSCGRLWVVVYKYGIRIYDKSATVLLASWPLSTGLADILLLDSYELFLSDYDNGKIFHFNPNLQCTS